MVTETIDIVVRERGAQRAGREISGIGGQARRAALGVRGLVGALAAAGAAAGLGALGRSAVNASAQIEGFGVRLRALLGSQQGANEALETFIDLSSRTPFAVNQIVGGATTLASVTGQNRDQLEELTQVAANLAAVTGLSFEQTAENLQRSLSAGIGSADLFRERGVRRLIEEVSGIPDATKLSTDQLLEAFRELAGESGKFGGAAEALSLTLTGALSNIGDAAFRFRAQLGDALAPAVIGAARAVFIPFFDDLRGQVEDNETAIQRLVINGVAGLADGFVSLVRTGAGVVRFLEDVGITGGRLRLAFIILRETGLSVFAVIRREIAAFRSNVLAAVSSFQQVNPFATEAERAAAFSNFNAAAADAEAAARGASEQIASSLETIRVASVASLGDDPNSASSAILAFADSVEGVGDRIRAEAEAFIEARREAQAARDELDSGAGGIGSGVDPAVLEAQKDGLEELLGISRQLTREELERQDPRLAAVADLDEQIGRVSTLQVAADQQALKEQTINRLIAERNRLLTETGQTERLANDTAAGITRGVEDAFATLDTDSFGGQIGGAVGRGLTTALTDFQDEFGAAIESLSNQLAVSLGGTEGGGLSSGIAAGIGAAASIGLALASGAGSGSSSVRSGLARSAVTSTQRVRGIVAGSEQVGIGQVNLELEEAFVETNRELAVQTRLLAEIRDGVTGGSGVQRTAEAVLVSESGGLG